MRDRSIIKLNYEEGNVINPRKNNEMSKSNNEPIIERNVEVETCNCDYN